MSQAKKDFDEIWEEFFSSKSSFLASIAPEFEEMWWDLFMCWDDIVPAMHVDIERGGKVRPDRFQMLESRIASIRAYLRESRDGCDAPPSIVALQHLTVQHLELLKLKIRT